MAPVNGIVLIMGGAVEDWRENTVYLLNDLIVHDGTLYICKQEHTSSDSFTTDLLSGKWKFIGNDVGSNVIQAVLYEGNDLVTSKAQRQYTIQSVRGYDYILADIFIDDEGDSYSRHDMVVLNPKEVGSVSGIQGTWTYFSGDEIKVAGAVRLDSDTQVTFSIAKLVSPFTGAYLKSVVGIKIQELTTSYIANLAMPSDVYEEIPFNFTTNSSVWESTEYVAPADGYFMVRLGTLTSASSTAQIVIETSNKDGVASRWTSTSQPAKTGRYISTEAPVVANRSVKVYVMWCNSTAEGNSVKFIYTVGDAKELGLID